MNRLRPATWLTLAVLAFTSGCQSCNNPCNGGFFSRLAARRNGVVCEAPCCVATPVSTMPFADCCEGGPMLGEPYLFGNGMALPPAANGGAPITTVPPMTTLPPPTANTAPPPLAPVPATPSPGLATPTPAQPSSRTR